jgi:tetratricopeptide (TPR) repeat protein
MPMLNIIVPLNAAMAEHWLYLPGIGFFIIAGTLMSTVLARQRRNTAIGVALSVIIIFSCGMLTIKRNSEWGNEIAFFQGIIERNPGIAIDRAHDNLARAYYRRGLYKAAGEEAKKIIAINPQYPEAYCLLGVLDGAQGLYDQSLKYLKKSLALNPYDGETYDNLGVTYAKMGLLNEAIQTWQKALRQNPYDKKARLFIRRAQQMRAGKIPLPKK